MYVPKQGEAKALSGTKVANQRTLRWGNDLNYPGGSEIITKVLKMEEGGRRESEKEVTKQG